MSNPFDSIRMYLRAKDENRPHPMARAFARAARLEVKTRTTAISLPPVTTGLEAITQVLVRDFGRSYENVYTFCLSDEPWEPVDSFRCCWLVGMSDKPTGSVRVGCGAYDWSFDAERPHLARRLLIDIEMMKVLPADALGPVAVSMVSGSDCDPRAA